MQIDLKPRRGLSAEDERAIAALREAVYPTGTEDQDPGEQIAWAETDWVVLFTDPAGSLVSMAGLLVRPAKHGNEPVRIGGLGNVKTHPEARRRGYADAAIAEVLRFHQQHGGIDFALLFCTAHNVPFYRKRGWQTFGGDVLIEQPQGAMRFTVYQAMCQALEHPAPEAGTIDLCGEPW